MTKSTLGIVLVVLVVVAGGLYWYYTQDSTQLPNPASVYCEEQGGTLETISTAEGEVGYCHLPDGRVCEEWALYRDGVCEPQENSGPVDSGGELPAAAEVRTHVASEAGVPRAEVVVVSAVPKEWSDGCLGLGGPNEFCTQAIVPGYLVVVEVAGQIQTYRTDMEGTVIRKEE